MTSQTLKGRKEIDKRLQPRWLQHLRAVLGSYFWLPCPLCGKYFGGHEWRDGDCLYDEKGMGRGVCANCGPKARRLYKKLVKIFLDRI